MCSGQQVARRLPPASPGLADHCLNPVHLLPRSTARSSGRVAGSRAGRVEVPNLAQDGSRCRPHQPAAGVRNGGFAKEGTAAARDAGLTPARIF